MYKLLLKYMLFRQILHLLKASKLCILKVIAACHLLLSHVFSTLVFYNCSYFIYKVNMFSCIFLSKIKPIVVFIL